MALRDELLGIKGIGPTLADQIMAVVEAEAERSMTEAIEKHDPRTLEVNERVRHVDQALAALRAAKTGCNPPNGCPLCGVDGCNEHCPAWNV